METPKGYISCKCRTYHLCERQEYIVAEQVKAANILNGIFALAEKVKSVNIHGRTVTDFSRKKVKYLETKEQFKLSDKDTALDIADLEKVESIVKRGKLQGGFDITAVTVVIYYRGRVIEVKLPYANRRLIFKYSLGEWCDNGATAIVSDLAARIGRVWCV